jgi:hypothetical protein
MTLPDIRAGIYRHYKGRLFLVLGYGYDANYEDREVVIYIGLELDNAQDGPRLAVRDVDDFYAIVDPITGEDQANLVFPVPGCPYRFTYVGPELIRDPPGVLGPGHVL